MGLAAGSTAAHSTHRNCVLDDIHVHRIEEHSGLTEKLMPLLRAARREGHDTLIQPLLDALSRGARRLDRDGEALYYVEHQGRVVAVCGRVADGSSPRTLRVRHAYVMPEYRGLGIARSVFHRFIADIPRGLFDRLILRAYFRPARGFCGVAGFRCIDGPDFTHELALS
jgi:GNAT superfamily N-acetyltransferase